MLTNIDLWEVSIVTFPANPSARVTAVKNSPTKRQLEHVLREAGLSRAAAQTLIATLDRDGALDSPVDRAYRNLLAANRRVLALIEAYEHSTQLGDR